MWYKRLLSIRQLWRRFCKSAGVLIIDIEGRVVVLKQFFSIAIQTLECQFVKFGVESTLSAKD
jgi:hypothetical protein